MLLTNEPSGARPVASKPHFIVLDGLRAVAAFIVVFYHIFEAFASSIFDQRVNHGYLAVDFFFLLSGFVLAYAYDDRADGLTVKRFLTGRLIRLHPMVLMGTLIGALMFYTQGCSFWDVTKVSIGSLLLASFCNALLIPALPSTEIRGLGEMYPLNGPSWSLFFEYIGNLLYIFILRRLSTGMLTAFVILSAVGLTSYAILGPEGGLSVGFSLTSLGFIGGFLRLLFSFSAGLLLARLYKPRYIRASFLICAAILSIVLFMPRVGDATSLWKNGLYDSFCCIVIFPLVVYLGASARVENIRVKGIYTFLGDISYPLYTVHYPFIYLYFAYVKNYKLSFEQTLLEAAAVFLGSLMLAYVCLRWYDIPLRNYLRKKLQTAK